MAATSLPESPIDRVLAAFKRVKTDGPSKWKAECPTHADDTQSLGVARGRDGRIVMTCRAGCDTKAVLAAVGLSMADLFAPGSAQPAVQQTTTTRTTSLQKTYDYTDADGKLLFQSCRLHDSATGKKTFLQRRRLPDGKWDWSLGGTTPVLYRLPEVLAAVESGRPVYIVEGEKDADNLAALGFTATTNPMGAGKWRESMSPVFTGADVVILPDNDEPGRESAERLRARANAARLRCDVLTPTADGDDWADVWAAAGADLAVMKETAA